MKRIYPRPSLVSRLIGSRVFAASLALAVALVSFLSAPPRETQAAGTVGTGTPASCTESQLNSALAGGGLVTFNCGGPQTLVITSVKTIATPTTIDGGSVITITGKLFTRLFNVTAAGSLTLKNISLDGGFTPVGGNGGAIINNGSLYVENSIIKNSHAGTPDGGGGIYTTGPTHIYSTTIKDTSSGLGSGIFATGIGAKVWLTNTTFNNNYASNPTLGNGGAIQLANQATLNDVGGSYILNYAARYGGAIYASDNTTATLRTVATQDTVNFQGNYSGEDGGAVWNAGLLNIDKANFIGNTTPITTLLAGYGGAIANWGGVLNMKGGYLALNKGRFGGAIYNGGGPSTAVISNTVFTRNSAGQTGGGLYSSGSYTTTFVSIGNSHFSYNDAVTGGGLARFNATVWVQDTVIFSNTATYGGGVYVGSGPDPFQGYLRTRNVTISGNRASSNQGGGVYVAGQTELYFATIKNNNNGVYTAAGLARFRSTALENPGSLNCDGPGGNPSNDGANKVSDSSCGPLFASSVVPSILVGDLEGSLETTFFHLPLAGSPLIDTGAVDCLPKDQRGALRNGPCDVGAVEYKGFLPRIAVPIAFK